MVGSMKYRRYTQRACDIEVFITRLTFDHIHARTQTEQVMVPSAEGARTVRQYVFHCGLTDPLGPFRLGSPGDGTPSNLSRRPSSPM